VLQKSHRKISGEIVQIGLRILKLRGGFVEIQTRNNLGRMTNLWMANC
jgi:hypothetical protein